jgi:hypothetical protein
VLEGKKAGRTVPEASHKINSLISLEKIHISLYEMLQQSHSNQTLRALQAGLGQQQPANSHDIKGREKTHNGCNTKV